MEYDIESLIGALRELKERADRLGVSGVSVYIGHKDGSSVAIAPDGHDERDVRLIAEGLATGAINARIGSIAVRGDSENAIAIVED